ncbi:MAG: hypothetical protein ACR2RE_14395 [Geminicoccaceae bacterium]
MALIDDYLLLERPHPGGLDGVQRLYRFPSGYGLSLVNSPMLHSYSFAWEAAVLKNVKENGDFDSLTYDTELTSDVEVFVSDTKANEFIKRAAELLSAGVEE